MLIFKPTFFEYCFDTMHLYILRKSLCFSRKGKPVSESEPHQTHRYIGAGLKSSGYQKIPAFFWLLDLMQRIKCDFVLSNISDNLLRLDENFFPTVFTFFARPNLSNFAVCDSNRVFTRSLPDLSITFLGLRAIHLCFFPQNYRYHIQHCLRSGLLRMNLILGVQKYKIPILGSYSFRLFLRFGT